MIIRPDQTFIGTTDTEVSLLSSSSDKIIKRQSKLSKALCIYKDRKLVRND